MTIRPRTFLAAGLLTAGLAAGAAFAEPADRITARYTIKGGGFHLGDFTVATDVAASSYESRVSLAARGMVGFFYSVAVEATAHGVRDGRAYRPVRFERRVDQGGDVYSLAMTFAGDLPDRIEWEPADAGPGDHLVEADKRRRALDPVTAIATLFSTADADPCTGTVQVYDGKRRYDVRLTRPAADAPFAGPPPPVAMRAGLVRCQGQYVRVAGFKPKHMNKPPLPPIEAWFRVENGPLGRYHVPQRIASSTDWGAVVIDLAAVETGAAPIRQAAALP